MIALKALKTFIFQLLVCFLGIAMPNLGFAQQPPKKPRIPFCVKSVSKLAPDADPLTTVDRQVKKWFELSREAKLKKGLLPIGTEIEFNNTTLKVLEILGQGKIGSVYLVNSADQKNNLRVAKIIKGEINFQTNLRMHNADPDLPQVFDIDTSKGVLLLEYKEGIPLRDVFVFEQELGFSKEKLKSIGELLVQAAQADPTLSILNAIYSPTENKIFKIDPY
ncbi:MAG: hypothetical protein IPM57_11990 [Oligoflexia bacterium]|nr:hypothetical protein [Oligoflexia bacterium]